MNYVEALAARRTQYVLNKDIPASKEEVLSLIEKVTALTPDAFNMRSARVVVALGEKQEQLWKDVYQVFGGKVPQEKIDGFRAAYGTVLYFIDEDVIEAMQKNVPRYAENFPLWANHANGMLQSNIWVGLRTLGIGANLQHYNPVIDDLVKKLFDLPDSWKLVAEMPFGGIGAPAGEKDGEVIAQRVLVKE